MVGIGGLDFQPSLDGGIKAGISKVE